MMQFLPLQKNKGCVVLNSRVQLSGTEEGSETGKASIPVSAASFTSASVWQVDLGGCYLEDGLPGHFHILLRPLRVEAGSLF